jgi:hypothetical protein
MKIAWFNTYDEMQKFISNSKIEIKIIDIKQITTGQILNEWRTAWEYVYYFILIYNE